MKCRSYFFCLYMLSGQVYAISSDTFENQVYEWTETLAQTLQTIGEKHIDPSNFGQAMENGIRAICNTLDPHSDLLPPSEYQHVTTAMSGSFCGIGVMVDATRKNKDKHLAVIEVISDGPADKAGVHAMDKIVEIDGKILEGMSTEKATAALQGKKNSVVQIKVLRENNNLISFDITRDKIKQHSTLCFYLKDNHICYLSLSVFTEQSANQLRKLLEESRRRTCKGLILDLRNNSGGLLQSALDIASLFVEKTSLVVTTKDRTGKEIDRYITKQAPLACTLPFIVILTNNFTASAAEILAGCLKIYSDRSTQKNFPIVLIVGTRTFGKGSVQEIIPIGKECAIKLTTSLYYLPDNSCIQASGIEPDLAVEKTAEQPEHITWYNQSYGREEVLANAIQLSPEKIDAKKGDATKKHEALQTKASVERSKEILATDNQFKEAISLVKILSKVNEMAPNTIKSRAEAVDFIKKHYEPGTTLTMTEIKI